MSGLPRVEFDIAPVEAVHRHVRRRLYLLRSTRVAGVAHAKDPDDGFSRRRSDWRDERVGRRRGADAAAQRRSHPRPSSRGRAIRLTRHEPSPAGAHSTRGCLSGARAITLDAHRVAGPRRRRVCVSVQQSEPRRAYSRATGRISVCSTRAGSDELTTYGSVRTSAHPGGPADDLVGAARNVSPGKAAAFLDAQRAGNQTAKKNAKGGKPRLEEKRRRPRTAPTASNPRSATGLLRKKTA